MNLSKMRTGVGVDAHQFGDSGPCSLAGLQWPDAPRLVGHSDGDAAAHALCDAVLSACQLGDIGTFFGVDTPEKGFRAQCPSEAQRGEAASAFTKKAIESAAAAGGKFQVTMYGWDKFGGRVLGDILINGQSLRAGLIAKLANLNPYPESVPINHLVPVPGTPLEDQKGVDPLEFVRTIAIARITMPTARVRLSAGRQELGRPVQAMCFMAGANSIFYGDKLLTTDNPEADADRELLAELGLKTKTACKTEVLV